MGGQDLIFLLNQFFRSSDLSYIKDKNWKLFEILFLINQIKPIEPAVKPTAKKNANSDKSLGIEFTIRHNWVILPCAPQVKNFLKI